ncbi:hypothetical protein DBR43_05575 [Pedobacter sp. KBW06]|uniref:hypothetical protein n=1 Tax=Pedobacter sp. KBW06 TaxID=2153359 RepID=UPI000F5AB36D|nr:hypothetical protein [Pedobacter sp. KBW06]RQO74850.1 hypothetical protein DBR43_05575 [Pedobacter sp. KBW06]
MLSLRKYIVVKGNPILFPSELIHAEVAGKDNEVESAGFFVVVKEKGRKRVICIGESTSLSISSKPETDQQLIANYLGLE